MHIQDIAVPLGIDIDPPVDAAIASIERTLTVNESRIRLRPPLRDVRLIATDADWAQGTGRIVQGPVKWLLLAVAGRPAAHQHLTGEVAALA